MEFEQGNSDFMGLKKWTWWCSLWLIHLSLYIYMYVWWSCDFNKNNCCLCWVLGCKEGTWCFVVGFKGQVWPASHPQPPWQRAYPSGWISMRSLFSLNFIQWWPLTVLNGTIMKYNLSHRSYFIPFITVSWAITVDDSFIFSRFALSLDGCFATASPCSSSKYFNGSSVGHGVMVWRWMSTKLSNGMPVTFHGIYPLVN